MPILGIVVPVFNEDELIFPFIEAVQTSLKPEHINYSITFVDDGSTDATWQKICEAHARFPQVSGISFSRNFGKEAAIFAGLHSTKADCYGVMDVDLQHPPSALPKMYRLWEQGYEVVNGIKASRGKETSVHKASAALFNALISRSIHIDMSTSSDYKLLDKKVVENLTNLNERGVFFRGLSAWAGYKTAYVDFNVEERRGGTTKWNNLSLLRYAIKNITSFSTFPLQFVSIAGALFGIFALVMIVQSLYTYAAGKAVAGFTTIIILILATGAIIMMSLGIIGGYIARMYVEVQHRPRYIVSQTTPENEPHDYQDD